MDWVIGVLISALGAAVWSVLVVLVRLRSNVSGQLSGDWYQVTYYGDDPAMQGIPWSVEMIKMRHRHYTVSGFVWRAHGPHFDRKWEFVGRYDEGHVDCIYWAVRGDGGKGSLHLWHVSRNNFRGRFVESKLIHNVAGMSIDYLEAPIEWVRVGSSEEQRVLPWLEPPEESEFGRYAPRRLVLLLRRRLSAYIGSGQDAVLWRQRLFERLSYGAAYADLSGPLAMEAEKKRRARSEAVPPVSPGNVLHPEHPTDVSLHPHKG